MVRARSSRPDDEKVLETLDDLAVQLHGALGRHWHPALADFPSR
jgi:hypothetical protein